MNIPISLILALAFLTFTVNTKLSIVSPTELSSKFKDNSINFSLSHYGNIPYGAHLTGRLVLFEPIYGCSAADEHLVKEKDDKLGMPIAVIKRGECRIAVKIRNAQLAGAKAVIIANNKDEELFEMFGHEHGTDDIKIPALMVTLRDGEEITSFLENKGNSPGDVIVTISFPYETKSNIVSLDYWYSSADSSKSTFPFLSEFNQIWKKNKENMQFTPHFVTWSCGECKNQNFMIKDNPDCISGGRYCAPDPDDEGPLNGADVISEDLRQACIFRTSQGLYWDYVSDYGDKCLGTMNMKECGDSIISTRASMHQRAAIDECIQKSFELPEGESRPVDRTLDDNAILREDKLLQIEYAVHQFPVLFINHKAYYGKLNHIFLVFEEICRNYKDLPVDCQVALSRTGESSYEAAEQDHTGRIVVLVIVMLVLSVLIFYCCKRLIRKENKDMSMQVGGMVTRYFALRDTNSSRDEER